MQTISPAANAVAAATPALRESGDPEPRSSGRSPVTLTLVNRKGGVAKTTSTLNIAAELHARGHRVLAVDLDSQGTLTTVAGYRSTQVDPALSALGALLPEHHEIDWSAVVRPAPWGGGLIPSHPDLAGAEQALSKALGPHARLRRALDRLAGDRDVVLVDAPPSTGKLVFNAMVAADALLVPVKCDYASVAGLERLFATIELVREYEAPELSVLGVFATFVRPTRHARETLETLVELLGDALIPAVIPENVQLQDAQAGHMAARQLAPRSRGAEAYARLTDEIVRRVGVGMPAAAEVNR